jgi:hypothetical protein
MKRERPTGNLSWSVVPKANRLGFPLAGARCVEPLGRGTTTTFASLLPDHPAIGETEPFPCSHERL